VALLPWPTQTVGTITHMAPELLVSGKLSAPSDVYSFGMISECQLPASCRPLHMPGSFLPRA
jgi:serine/threonine protein kinase